MDQRPKFVDTFCKSIRSAWKRKDILSLVPYWLLLGLALGSVVASLLPASYWSDENLGASTTVFSGFLTFDGLLLALGWGAFAKIYEMLGTGWLAVFLKRNKLLGEHLFFVDAVHGILVVSAVSSGVALVTVLLTVPLIVDRIIFAFAIGLSVWSLVKAFSAMRLMNDLVWESAQGDPIEEENSNSDGAGS